jgi:hypothetical protein
MRFEGPDSEAYNRLALDGMKLSAINLKDIKASMTEVRQSSVISSLCCVITHAGASLRARTLGIFLSGILLRITATSCERMLRRQMSIRQLNP